MAETSEEGAEHPILVYLEKTGDWTDDFWFNKLQMSSLLSSLPWVWVQLPGFKSHSITYYGWTPALGHSGGGEISQEDGCYEFNCVLPKSHVEALTPSMTVFGDRPFRR